MKFILLSCDTKPITYYWQLNIGDEQLYKSQTFPEQPMVISNIEKFRFGLFSLPVVDENGELLRSHRINPEQKHPWLLRVTPADNHHWQWEICTADGVTLSKYGSYKTREDAANNISAFVMDIYLNATVVNKNGCVPPLLAFSRRYRETFGLVDMHPSARLRR